MEPWKNTIVQTIADVVCKGLQISEDGVQNYFGKKSVDNLISTSFKFPDKHVKYLAHSR
ncbi:MAG TPA: hypothetical protein VNA18_00280 [Nitrososphaeraceae archaeon]|nr:hypothetical protein [Nitrososphaeraceae archaeon]